MRDFRHRRCVAFGDTLAGSRGPFFSCPEVVMSRRVVLASSTVLFVIFLTTVAMAGSHPATQTSNIGQQCVACHSTITPNVVSDWKQSKHHEVGIECDTCHGSAHMTATDAAKATIPTPETCAPVP